MSQSARIATVRRHRQREEDTAARELGEASSALRDQSQVLDNLSTHRRGYQAGLLEQAQRGMSAANLRRQLTFIRTLGNAVDGQQRRVEASRGNLRAVRENWMGCHRASESLGQLEGRLREAESQATDRRETRDQEDQWLARNGQRA